MSYIPVFATCQECEYETEKHKLLELVHEEIVADGGDFEGAGRSKKFSCPNGHAEIHFEYPNLRS